MSQQTEKLKLLRLATTLNPTSAPYNQFSLGFKKSLNQTFCSLMRPEVHVDQNITAYHADGSIMEMLKLLRKLTATEKFDVIHIHSGVMGIIFIMSLFPVRLGMLRESVFTLHNSWSVLKRRNRLLNFAVMISARKTYACGLASRRSIPRIIEFFVGKKTGVIVNGFDDDRIDRVARSRSTQRHFGNQGHLRLVYVGALNDTKNQVALLDALANTNIYAELIFLGDGKNRESLMEYSQHLPSNCDISFKGRVSRDVAIEHMLEADVCISLSKGEGMPIAVLEAMYAGCFLILSSIPPHTEICPPESRCIFVDHTNRQDILAALAYVTHHVKNIRATNPVSTEHAQSNFSVKNMLAKYHNSYKQIRRVQNC